MRTPNSVQDPPSGASFELLGHTLGQRPARPMDVPRRTEESPSGASRVIRPLALLPAPPCRPTLTARCNPSARIVPRPA